MYYAVIGTIKTVVNSAEKMQRLRTMHPYTIVRKFRTEEEAYEYLANTQRRVSLPNSVTRYSKRKLSALYITVNYIIGREGVYYTLNTGQLGRVGLTTEDPNIIISNSNLNTSVFIKGLILNPDILTSHLIAIINILDIMGDLVDVEIEIPYPSIFLLLTKYSGTNKRLINYIDKIMHRRNTVALTVRRFLCVE